MRDKNKNALCNLKFFTDVILIIMAHLLPTTVL